MHFILNLKNTIWDRKYGLKMLSLFYSQSMQHKSKRQFKNEFIIQVNNFFFLLQVAIVIMHFDFSFLTLSEWCYWRCYPSWQVWLTATDPVLFPCTSVCDCSYTFAVLQVFCDCSNNSTLSWFFLGDSSNTFAHNFLWQFQYFCPVPLLWQFQYFCHVPFFCVFFVSFCYPALATFDTV